MRGLPASRSRRYCVQKMANFFVVDVYSDCMNVFWPINWQLIMIFIPLKLFWLKLFVLLSVCVLSFFYYLFKSLFQDQLRTEKPSLFSISFIFFASKDHSSINTRLTEWLDWLADKLRVVVTLLDCEIFWDRLDL